MDCTSSEKKQVNMYIRIPVFQSVSKGMDTNTTGLYRMNEETGTVMMAEKPSANILACSL